MAVVAEEYYGHDEAGIRTAALCTELTVNAGAVPNASRRIKLIRERKVNSSAWRNIRLAFLPEGYPNSVTPDYLPFQTWDTLQGLSTYIRSMLSTQALLTGIGVGQNTASVLGATFQWFLRDFTGMLGGILFTLFKGSNLDSNAKQWRLAADFMNDIGMLLDLLSPMFPSVFVFMLCLGSLSRSITGVASGATRAALTQHFALRQNAADVSAKEGSQETLATMVGMLVGMLVARITSGHVLAIWGCFLSLTAFHMYANYRAVSCLCLTSLNRERVSILLKAFVSSDKVLTPQQVAQREQILPLPFISFWNKSSVKTGGRYDRLIKFGVRLSSVDFGPSFEKLHTLQEQYKTEKYMLVPGSASISVILHRHAASGDILRAYVHALRLVDELESFRRGQLNDTSGCDSAQWMSEVHTDFIDGLMKAGWMTDRILLRPGEWRAEWLVSRKGD